MTDVLGGGQHASELVCTRHPDRPAVVALVLDHVERRGAVTTRFLCHECHIALLSWWYDPDLDTP